MNYYTNPANKLCRLTDVNSFTESELLWTLGLTQLDVNTKESFTISDTQLKDMFVFLDNAFETENQGSYECGQESGFEPGFEQGYDKGREEAITEIIGLLEGLELPESVIDRVREV